MAYQVIARKWRPQAFEEVTGQEHITRTLRNAIEHERLHHAYLFSGARGVGKTTTARLLAKAVNCHRAAGPTTAPCRATDPDQCPSCREIAEGRSIDVLEIDAASNTGVGNVRDTIIDTIGVRAARDRYKVFIIDEVHMLSGAAFNALLKTLEEPPPRVLFIMATTESHKVPDTILSRCQQFEFRVIAAPKIVERLRLIADAEQIKVSDDALREIARAGEGSMRDAQSAFDQVISFSEGEIANVDVEAALGLASRELLARVMRAVGETKPAEALAVVDDLVMRGHDLRNFCRDLMGHLRDLLIVKVAGDASPHADATDAERRELANAAREFSESDLVRFFHSLTETEKSLRESAHPRYQLEIGLVKLVEMRRLAPLAQVIERLNALEAALRTGTAPAANPGPPASPGAAPASSGSSTRGSSSSSSSGSSARGGSNVGAASANPPQSFSPSSGTGLATKMAETKEERALPSSASHSAPTATSSAPPPSVAPAPARPNVSDPARSAAPSRPASSSSPSLKLVPSSASGAGHVASDDRPPFPLDDDAPPFRTNAPQEPAYFADIPAGADHVGSPIAFDAEPSASVDRQSFEADDIISRLKQTLDAQRKPFLAVALDGAKRVTLADGELCAEFAPEGKHLRDMLDKAENKRVLCEACRQLTGRETAVRVIVKRPGHADEPLTARDEALLEQKRLRAEAESEPRVQQMLRIFRAEIVEVLRVGAEPQ